MAEPLSIRTPATLSSTQVTVFSRWTASLNLQATYENPFDSREVQIDAEVQCPSGSAWTAPGFLNRSFRRELVDGVEQLTAVGEPRWEVRLSFREPGRHRVRFRAQDRSGEVVSPWCDVEAVAADHPGHVRRHESDYRYFVTDSGDTFFLVGANVCWGGRRGTFDYDEWLPSYAANGGNYFRIWLSPSFALAMNTRTSGYDGIDLGNAWRLDHILELSERSGLRAMLCLDSFNTLRSKKRRYGLFEESPWHVSQGGPVSAPGDFFSHAEAQRAYRDRLRYLVGRYGYSTSVFAWELWNEVDITDAYDSNAVTGWHRQMGRALKDLDPWDHLVTTSTSRHQGDATLDAIPELDFVQTHHYQARDIVAAFGVDRSSKKAAADRPHFHGEYGISHSGKTTRDIDPKGVHLRNGLYSSIGQEHAGIPMTWWWDSYVHPQQLYRVFGSFSRWIAGFDPVREGARPIRARIAPRDEDAARLGAVEFRLVGGSWQAAPFNKPVSVRAGVGQEMTQDAPLATVLHGLDNHPKLHNPVTFVLNVPQDTAFHVDVISVSGHGGAKLQISLDNKLVREEDFADTDGTSGLDRITTYNGAYSVDLPAGQHTVLVENVGKDWVELGGYRIDRFPAIHPPSLRVLGLIGDAMGLIWFQNPAYTWTAVCRNGRVPPAIPLSWATLEDVPAGTWRVEWWDTGAGRTMESERARVGEDRVLVLAVPEVQWDTAVRLTRLSQPK